MENTNTWTKGDTLVSTYFKGADARFNTRVTYLGEGDAPGLFTGQALKDGEVHSDWVRDMFVKEV